jgi:iron complex transport system permease protein
MIEARHGWGLFLLLVFAVAIVAVSLLTGSAHLTLNETWHALSGGGDDLAAAVMQQVRLPRTLSAFAVGSLLGLAGTLLQALFRNPLADPYVLGVSGGAAVGALSGMLLGTGLAGLHAFATAGALLVGLLTLSLGRGGGLLRLLLTGVVLASACGALVSVMLAVADNSQLRGMVFWLAGDLSWALSPTPALLLALLGILAALIFGRLLNVLAAGEMRSASLGLPTGAARAITFLIAALLTAVAVISAGPVGFVGLIAPHLVRLALGTADHRVVAPGAALAGGALLCLADLASRTLAAPRQLPVGAVMALIGAPVFLLLLRRQTRELK